MLITIIKLAVVVSLISIFYKIYLESKLNKENRKSRAILFRTYYGVASLFPISKRGYSNADHGLIKKANRALLVFYAAFILLLILSVIEFSIES